MDWRLPWLDVGGLRVYVDSISCGRGSSGGEIGGFAEVNDEA